MTTVDFGFLLTGYCLLSLVLFLATSFTTLGWIIHGFILIPLYGLVVLIWWLVAAQIPARTVRLRRGLWAVVLVLQLATILASPGNCYAWKQGNRCYSNLQVLMGRAPAGGSSRAPHWSLVENNFHTMALAYGASVVLAVSCTSVSSEP
jgi:hypothetical protein